MITLRGIKTFLFWLINLSPIKVAISCSTKIVVQLSCWLRSEAQDEGDHPLSGIGKATLFQSPIW
jgi:hypothetical protein